jgi:hypothetical protein
VPSLNLVDTLVLDSLYTWNNWEWTFSNAGIIHHVIVTSLVTCLHVVSMSGHLVKIYLIFLMIGFTRLACRRTHFDGQCSICLSQLLVNFVPSLDRDIVSDHTFVANCIAESKMPIGWLKNSLAKHQRILNNAAWRVTDSWHFDRDLLHVIYHDMNNIAEFMKFRTCMMA